MHLQPTTAAVDIGEFLTDLDGGAFAAKLAVALTQQGLAVLATDKKGTVTLTFEFERIEGAIQQVVCQAGIKSKRPTINGWETSEDTRPTMLHVSTDGNITLLPRDLYAPRQSKLPA